MKIAVLGSGHGAFAAAAHMALEGHEVRLWGRTPERYMGVLDAPGADGPGTIELVGPIAGSAAISLVTADAAKVTVGADVILVPAPAFAHEALVAAVAAHVEPGQVIALLPGNMSSPLVRRVLDDAGVSGVAIVETATLPYGARRRGERAVAVPVHATRNPAAALGKDQGAVDILADLYPAIEHGEDLVDVFLVNPNPMVHPALMVANAGAIEHFPIYDIHRQGTGAATLRLIYAVDAERIATREAFGYRTDHFPQTEFYDPHCTEGMWPGGAEPVKESELWTEGVGLDFRYLDEDAAIGLSMVVDLAAAAGVPAPVASAVLDVASALRGIDLRASGRRLSTLALPAQAAEIRAHLAQ
jgi:opine dehydrogenase